MLACIILYIIKLKTVYSYEIHHYDGCNQSLTSRVSTLPIFRKVKPAIQNYKVPIKSVSKFFILDSEINFIVKIMNYQMGIHLVVSLNCLTYSRAHPTGSLCDTRLRDKSRRGTFFRTL